jgi:hypothetical protein
MRFKIAVIAAVLVGSSNVLLADTLVLTNGRRIQGELIGVFGREIEFEERTGFRRQVIRVPRRDIARIEFDETVEAQPGRGDDPAPTGGIPRGMRERQVNVTGREAWTDTGIDVRPGQMIYFTATGEVRWGPNRRDGAAGERNSPRNAQRPMPDRPAAALIGRVGTQDEFFFIGAEPGPFRVRSAGRLYLGINDDVFMDNTGSLRVTVAY